MHERSIELLNKAIADEMLAVHQYMYFHFLCDDQGYDLLAGLFKKTAIEEMIHVERLAERILFLKEASLKINFNLVKYKKTNIGLADTTIHSIDKFSLPLLLVS